MIADLSFESALYWNKVEFRDLTDDAATQIAGAGRSDGEAPPGIHDWLAWLLFRTGSHYQTMTLSILPSTAPLLLKDPSLETYS
jgi:hypothetical protein